MMKALDIALKDLTRSFRSAFALIFMFGVPLLVTGMFYLMFGSRANGNDFDLPRTRVIIANLDEGGAKFQFRPKEVPGARKAQSMGELIVAILESDDLRDLLEITYAPDASRARLAVDNQEAQVAIIIPADFSRQFADQNGKASIEFYQDPTLTLAPGILRTILSRFTDGMSGIKIAVDVFLDETEPEQAVLAGQVVQQYLEASLVLSKNPQEELLDVVQLSGDSNPEASDQENILVNIISPIMGGMLVFYAFFTGASTAQSILKEDEERTLPRLFTTPTSPTDILCGKLLSVILTVAIQVIVLLIAARFLFGIDWGDTLMVTMSGVGIILSASSYGVFVNSYLKNTKQGGMLFGGLLTIPGILGMISIFAASSPAAARMGDTVSLLVPQGWAVRCLLQTMGNEPGGAVLFSVFILGLWSALFFGVGIRRFWRRYA